MARKCSCGAQAGEGLCAFCGALDPRDDVKLPDDAHHDRSCLLMVLLFLLVVIGGGGYIIADADQWRPTPLPRAPTPTVPG